jgi:hypothetical protein
VGVARPQKCRDQVSALAVEDEQRVVDVLLVVAVVEGALLLSVGGICGSIKVQKYFLRSAIFLSLIQVELEENLGYLAARASGSRVLHPRDGRLARKVGAALRHRAAGELEQGVFAQGVRIVLVLVSARYLVDALANERSQPMAALPLSPFRHALGDGCAQPEFRIHLREPHEPAVGSDASSVERGFQSEGGFGLKTHRLCGTIVH